MNDASFTFPIFNTTAKNLLALNALSMALICVPPAPSMLSKQWSKISFFLLLLKLSQIELSS